MSAEEQEEGEEAEEEEYFPQLKIYLSSPEGLRLTVVCHSRSPHRQLLSSMHTIIRLHPLVL